MLSKPLLSPILDNEALTRGLGDAEARVLVEWLVEEAERLSANDVTEDAVVGKVGKLCRRGRAIGRFVRLWCHEGAHGAAVQLAAVERFTWPLPYTAMEACDLMQLIVYWEAAQLRAA